MRVRCLANTSISSGKFSAGVEYEVQDSQWMRGAVSSGIFQVIANDPPPVVPDVPSEPQNAPSEPIVEPEPAVTAEESVEAPEPVKKAAPRKRTRKPKAS